MSNYAATIVKIGNINPHPNADRLNFTNIFFNTVIIGKSVQINDLGVFFPIESQLSESFCEANNLIRKESVVDGKKVNTGGMFADNRRVRCQKLRGLASMGFWVEFSALEKWAKHVGIKLPELKEGDSFEEIGGKEICCKYINRQTLINDAKAKKQKKAPKQESRVIEGQYSLALDTGHLKREIRNINPEDYITISDKWHGCNFSAGNVLCKKKLKWYEKLLKKLGINIVDTEYNLLYASRRVLKNGLLDNNNLSHYYSEDIWGKMAEKYKNSFRPGISGHAELVGYTSDNGFIQKGYHYGQPVGTADLYFYRIFYTDILNNIYEFTTPQLINYCQLNGLKTVPIHFYGKAKDKYPELSIDEHWHENFLNKLIEEYLEKECKYNPGLPLEGIVLTKNMTNFSPLKLKSLAFLERETKELDSGESNVEDAS